MAQTDRISQYNSSIVRIWRGTDVKGVGFFINSFRILTCAHVIDSSLDSPLQFNKGESLESNFVTLDFPLRSPRKKTKAKIVFYDSEADIAVLELVQEEFTSDNVSPTIILDNHKFWGHSFRAFGFPRNINVGVWITGEILGETESGWIQIEDNDMVGHFVEEGFSGGPVWDDQIQAIIGMVVAFEKPNKDLQNQRTAFFISTKKVAEKWPELWSNSFGTITKQWNKPVLAHFEEREHDTFSPLSDPWESYLRKKPWNQEVEEEIKKLAAIAHEHKELLPFKAYLANINFSGNYEKLWGSLKQIVNEFNENISKIVYHLVEQLEKELNVTCRELIKRRQSRFTENEEKLLRLYSIPEKIRDLNNKYVINTQFNQCFLVMGEMGSGKSYFINKLSNEVGAHWIALLFANYPENNISDAICESISQASGLKWPDLKSINEYLANCEKHTFMKHKLTIVFDDLSRFGLLHHNFLNQLAVLIKENTQLHNCTWVLTAPEAYYASLAAYSGPKHSFWFRYGFVTGESKLPAIDKWIILDDLDRSEEVGVTLIHGFLSNINPSYSKINEQFNEILVEEIKLKELLCNPLIAWIWLDHILKVLEQNSMLERDWKYIQFISEFWKKQARLLIEKEENNNSINPVDELELRKYVLWIVRYLRTTGDIFLFREALLQQIILFSVNDHTPVSQERAALVLDNLKQGLIIREHIKPSLYDETDIIYEILMEGFWGSLLSHQIFKQINIAPKSSSELEQYFDTIHPRLRQVTLEFFLWIIDSQEKLPGVTFRLCNLVLQSSKLPHSAVWRMGIRANENLQKALLLRANQYIKQDLDADTTYAIMSYLCKLPLSVASIPERFYLYQIMYPAIEKHSLASYFYYIVQYLFAKAEKVEELTNSLPSFSHCEVLGMTPELAEFIVKTYLKIVYRGEFVFVSAQNCDESIKDILGYLDNIRTEYPEHKKIPNQTEGWNRYLFREWFLYYYFSEMTAKTGVEIYDVLRDLNWYRYRDNHCLKKHMEQEANIAIGRLYRWRSSYGDERPFSKFINDLVESKLSTDRQNAFFIIYHTVPTMSGEMIDEVSPEFKDALTALYSDDALSKIKNSSLGRKIFGQFGLGNHQ